VHVREPAPYRLVPTTSSSDENIIQRELAHKLVILRMGPNPKPQQIFADLSSQRSVVQSNSDGTILSNFLEAQGPMRRVYFKKLEVLVRKFLNWFRQSSVTDPEVRRSKVLQISLLFPARCSAKASSASLSSLPARRSSSIWRSHSSESYSRNHLRKANNSFRLSLRISCSIFSTFVIPEPPIRNNRIEKGFSTSDCRRVL